MDIKREIKIIEYWDEKLTLNDKINLLTRHHFWDGLATYSFKYIPEDLKDVLWLKMQENT